MVLEGQREVAEASEDLGLELPVDVALHVLDELAEDGAHLLGDGLLVAARDVRDALQGGLEDGLLLDLHEAVVDHPPVLLEVVLEEVALEADGRRADQVDAFRVDPVDPDVRVDEVNHLPPEVVVDAVLGQREHAGVDDGDELGVDDLEVDDLDVVVGVAGVDGDEVLDEHRQHVLLARGHHDAHHDDDDLLVGVALLAVVQVQRELLDQLLQDAVRLVREHAVEVLQLVGYVRQHPQAQHHHVLVVALGEAEQVVGDHGDVLVLEEDPREGLRESQEPVERVLLDDEVGVVD